MCIYGIVRGQPSATFRNAPTSNPNQTVDPDGLLIDIYMPENNPEAFKFYIDDLDYKVETGGNGGSGTITQPILVRQGTTYDGKGEKLTAKGMGTPSEENERPCFLLEPGASLKNVTIGKPGVAGVHCMRDNTIENVHWEDIGENALAVRSYFP